MHYMGNVFWSSKTILAILCMEMTSTDLTTTYVESKKLVGLFFTNK